MSPPPPPQILQVAKTQIVGVEYYRVYLLMKANTLIKYETTLQKPNTYPVHFIASYVYMTFGIPQIWECVQFRCRISLLVSG
jgi:hypothetical protein